LKENSENSDGVRTGAVSLSIQTIFALYALFSRNVILLKVAARRKRKDKER
jgi:hypothetical protein